MTKGILVDAGPLIAIVDRNDQDHDTCVAALKRLRHPLFTTRIIPRSWSPSFRRGLLRRLRKRAPEGAFLDDTPVGRHKDERNPGATSNGQVETQVRTIERCRDTIQQVASDDDFVLEGDESGEDTDRRDLDERGVDARVASAAASADATCHQK